MKNYRDGGEAILEALRNLGVDYIISSPGSEWSPVWEALARQKINNTPGPAYIDCWHETVAVDMALGYTQMTGRLQTVLLHAGPGPLQGSIGIYAALLAEIPILIMSGESVTYGENPDIDIEPQWFRSLSVVGGPQRLVAPMVKWAGPVPSPQTLYGSVTRTAELAQRVPMGPTYLSVPLETMLHDWTPSPGQRKVPQAIRPQVRPEQIAEVATLLAKAENPVVITESAGRDPAGFAALIELAELFALPVFGGELNSHANFPKRHPLFQGSRFRTLDPEPDVVLLVGSRSPWYPPSRRATGGTVVAIGDNPLKTNMVYQNFQADLYLEGDLASALRSLAEVARRSGIEADRYVERRQRWARAHDKLESNRCAAAATAARDSVVHPVALCAALAEVMPADTIYVDETITHAGAVQTHLPCELPQSYFRCIGGLGQGMGWGLGIRLAERDRPVVVLVGDGSFLYNPALQALGASQKNDLPILVVVFNNNKYEGMKKGHVKYYQDGAAASANVFHGVDINGPDYADLGKLYDLPGWRVDNTAELKPALQAGLRAMRDGKTAIVNVMLSA